MKRLLRAIEIVAWVGFFACAAAVLAVRFWLLPDIERYREDIVAAVSGTVGQPVKIGRIEAGWLGINPQVNLYDVRILDARGREALVLPAVENSIAWRSLLFGELRLHALAIDGPKLDVRRDRAGDLYVAGMRIAQGGSGEGKLADWVLAQPEIQIRNAEVDWHDERRGAPALKLSALNFRLRNGVWDHSAGVSARLPPELGTTLELRASLSGHSFADRGAWRGTVYAETGYTDLAAWQPWIDYPFELKQGHGALRLWAGIERGRLASVTADVQLLDLLPQMAPAAFRIAWKPSPRNPEGAFSAKEVDLGTFAALAGVLPMPAELRERIAALAPRGRLQDVKVGWKGAPEAPAGYSVRARFSGAAASAAGGLPGFSGLNGTLEASEKGGSLQLDSRQVELHLPELFPEPRLALDSLSGQVSWTLQERGWKVSIASLSLANADLEAHAAGSYSTPGFGRGAIDLTAEIRRANGTRIARYLPHGHLMGPRTRDYLASSIKAGRGRDAKLRLRGELADFPFRDPAKGEFQVTASVDEGVFEPGEGWPRIDGVEVQLLFERDRMEITGRRGMVGAARLSDVKVEIPQLSAPSPHIVASGRAEGSIEDYADFLRSSRVREVTGGLADGVAGTGRGSLELKLDVPLEDRSRTQVAGDFSFSASTLAVHPDLPPIERATGRFSFTESSFVVRQGRGRLFGGPLAVSGGSRAGGALEVRARGDASMASLAPLLPEVLRKNFAGAAPYTATLSLGDGRGRVSVESSLRGVASTLPPPLAKGAADALPLRVDLARTESGRDRVTIQLGVLARAELLRQGEGNAMAVQRAAISLSPPAGEAVRLPERAGVLVYGALPALDADRWLAALDAGAPNGSSGSSSPVPDRPVALDVRIGALDVYGRRIHDLALAATLEAGGWSAKVGAKELAGDLSYRGADGGSLVARLSHLTIPADAPAGPGPAKANAPQPARRDLPAVDLVVDRFTLKTHELGRVEVVAARVGANWRIDKLAVTNEDGVLTGKGSWHTGSEPLTSLSLDLDAPHPGRLLRRLGYGDVLRGGHVRMQAGLTWAGDVTTIHYPSLTGEIQMQAEDGRFVQLDPGVGKLLSVMSLQALPRRLTLDFRDVFSSGFQFERVRSAAHIEKGIMTLKDFQMSGSSAEVSMTGSVDLVRETQALGVRVIPQLGDTASTALLFVNPFLFFPAAIAQRILKDPLGHIFAFNYSVTGSWEDPKIERTAVNARPVQPEPSGQ